MNDALKPIKTIQILSSIFIIVWLLNTSVIAQTVAIGLEKMNVFYVGVDNPLVVAVENYPCDKIRLSPSVGTITKISSDCHFIYRIDSCSTFFASIFVGIEEGNSLQWIDTLDYRIKKTKTPRVCVAGVYYGLVKKEQLVANHYVFALNDDFDFPDYARITSFSCEIWRKDSLIYQEKDIQGNKFSENIISKIAESKKGDRLLIFNAYALVLASPCVRELQSVSFEIE